MALSETIPIDGGISGVYTPLNAVTEIHVSGTGGGQVFLQKQVPGWDWKNTAFHTGGYVMATPDVAITYRIKVINNAKAVDVYIGP